MEKIKIYDVVDKNFNKYFSHIADENDKNFLSNVIYNILKHDTESLEKLGKELFLRDILLTHFFYIMERVISLLEKDGVELQLRDMLTAKKSLAKGYIHQELKFDRILFDKYRKRKVIAESKELSIVLNMHINWMINFIDAILDGTIHKDNSLDKWIELTDQIEIQTLHDDTYKKVNSFLKTTAKRLVEAYKEGKYFYFSVLYRELMGYSSKMQNMLILNFMSEEIISIYIDYLTGLDNQFKLKNDLIKYQNKYLLLIDVHGFKKINITYGFDIGDKVLKFIADKLKQLKNCKVYRFIGNEFALILDRKEQPYNILKKLESEVCSIDNRTISLFFYGSFGKIEPKILEYAEYGLMEAKKLKNHIIDIKDIKSKHSIPLISNGSRDVLSINVQIKIAVASDKIVPYFQGIFKQEKDALNLIKYEALMRIESTDGSTISPSDFMDVMKNTYLYSEATKTMFLKCVDVVEKKNIEISFNLSVLDIINQQTTKFIKTLLIEKPTVSEKITFEITEEEAIENFKQVREFIYDVKKLGAKIAIDDFGSGYANYSYIFNMNPDYIKIDGNLVSEILTNNKQVIFIKSLVNMCKSIGIKTIAEFVDSKEKLNKLKELGVDYFQGFYLHKPEPMTPS